MQQQIKNRYKISGLPVVPNIKASVKNGDLSKYALRFLRTSCEDLRFKSAISASKPDDQDKVENFMDRIGKSYSENQIPLLMEMDIDRLCLEHSLNEFFKDPTSQKAYLVYYCYLEMFLDPESEGTRAMIEMLSEFEQKASPLTLKHRDHFVHTIYVFALGLAIFDYSAKYREAYRSRYNLNSEKETAHHYLKYWGFTALFHDLGYPFELAYTQVSDYFVSQRIPSFFVSYRRPSELNATVSTKAYQPLYQALMPDHSFATAVSLSANDVFAASLADCLHPEYAFCKPYQKHLKKAPKEQDNVQSFCAFLKQQLDWKPSSPEKFGNYMDHAYFSAYLMLHQLWQPGQTKYPDKDYLDALTAILMHNSLFKHTILKDAKELDSYPPLKMNKHPLAFMLMLCDELQCWDRFGYGRNTKRENDPIDCKLELHSVDGSNPEERITLTYFFDKNRNDINGTLLKMQGDSDSCVFIQDIERLLQINEKGNLFVEVKYVLNATPDHSTEPLSRIDFLHMYDLALLLHGEYLTRKDYTHDTEPGLSAAALFTPEALHREFQKLSLEYRLANLYRVLRFAEQLDKENIFFSDRPVSFPELGSFTQNQLEQIGNSEHEAWSQLKKSMGWNSGKQYTNRGIPSFKRNNLRECLRQHQYLDYPFDKLTDSKKQKDTVPIKQMQAYMKKYYKIKLFQLRRK